MALAAPGPPALPWGPQGHLRAEAGALRRRNPGTRGALRPRPPEPHPHTELPVPSPEDEDQYTEVEENWTTKYIFVLERP